MLSQRRQNRIVYLAALLLSVSTISTSQTTTVTKSINELDQYVNKLTAKEFTGSVLIARNGQVLLARGYGLADRERKIPNTTKTVFEIGSTSKQFTAFAITDLVVESRLSFSQTLKDFFDNVPGDKQRITIHQLLTHSSGLQMYHDKKGPLENLDQAEALKRIFEQKLKFSPGEKYDYSNSGYTLLALIIEKVTGKDFRSHLKKLLADMAKIRLGFYGEKELTREAVACGYGFQVDGHPFDRGTVSWAGLGAGYMMLSPEDYLRWMQFLTSENSLRKYGTHLFGEYVPYSAIDAKAFYGYGWVTLYKGDEKVIYHNGGDTSLGYISTVRYYPKRKMIVIISANNFSYEPHKLFEVKNKIESLFFFLNTATSN